MKKSDDPNAAMLRALNLIALLLLREMKLREQVEFMDRAGYGQSEIAELLGSTPKSISVRLAEIRKTRKPKP
jgi:hypothetical protein